MVLNGDIKQITAIRVISVRVIHTNNVFHEKWDSFCASDLSGCALSMMWWEV